MARNFPLGLLYIVGFVMLCFHFYSILGFFKISLMNSFSIQWCRVQYLWVSVCSVASLAVDFNFYPTALRRKRRNYLNFLIFLKSVLCPTTWIIAERVQWATGKNMYPIVSGWTILWISVTSQEQRHHLMQVFLLNNFVEFTCPSLGVKPQVLKGKFIFFLVHASEELMSIHCPLNISVPGESFFFFFLV